MFVQTRKFTDRYGRLREVIESCSPDSGCTVGQPWYVALRAILDSGRLLQRLDRYADGSRYVFSEPVHTE
ncbi:MAG: hypothetical protein AMXMBFR58_38520 [Phycisphaerae bacterium]